VTIYYCMTAALGRTLLTHHQLLLLHAGPQPFLNEPHDAPVPTNVSLGQRRFRDKLHLIPILPKGGRSLVPKEWTDLEVRPLRGRRIDGKSF
jgi:hypothetical protein